jgi:peptidoglycan/xylan/chitin deacetylase (PgdA/CDA1 family)
VAALPAVEYRPEDLRERRATDARRRRRQRYGALAAVLALGGAAAAVVATESPGAARHPSPGVAVGSIGAAQAGGEAPGLPNGQATQSGLETAAQVAAVRRLAAYRLPLFCGGRSKPMVALTFDDGPGVYTHFAIRKLRAYHLEATFFLVGKEIYAWPGRAQREKPYAAFGDHTMTHPFLPALPQSEMVQQIAGAKALIERTVREPVVLFRPPYEGRSPAIQHEVTTLGMLEVLWNVDSQDSLGANYAGIERNVIAGLHPGSIILMHENHGQTVRAMPTIFSALARRRLEAVTVPQLVAEDPPSLHQLRAGIAGCPVSRQRGNGS